MKFKFYSTIKNHFNKKKLPKKNGLKTALKTAFSLIELSILLMFLAVVISGILSTATASIVNRNTKITNDNFLQIYQALGAFLLSNKRLPCPASIIQNRLNDATYGTEVANCSGSGVYQSNSSSNIVYGMVPFKALGLSEQIAIDGYKSKIAYVVDKRFTVASEVQANFANVTFSTAPSTNTIIIRDKLISSDKTLTNDAILVLITYGANKFSAFDPDNSTQNTRSTDISELDNDITNFINGSPSSATFDNIFLNSASFSLIFDDDLFYKTKQNLIDDFKAQGLIACFNSGSFFANRNGYFDEVLYATRGCWAPENRKRLTTKCLADGSWIQYSQCTFCTIATVSGVNSINVNIGSGTLTCNQPGRSGTVSYQCFIDGSFTTSGNCN
ncbi:MAG: type II secretion system protein [Alphaproteobacteria bacterium]